MKNIKDYIHLYLGCAAWDLTENRLASIGKIEDDGAVQLRYPVYGNGYAQFNYIDHDKFKLILRPLSDMTEDELKYRRGLYDVKVHGNDEMSSIQWNALSTSYMLKQGFDLFGLIEEGLAIDKTKLPIK